MAPEYPDGWNMLQSKLYSYILDKYPTNPVIASDNRDNFSQVAAFIITYFEKDFKFIERKPEQFINTITLWPNLLNEALMLYCYATNPNDIIGKQQSAPGL